MQLTIDELRVILAKAIGEEDEDFPDGFADTPLDALGIDSLSLIETVHEAGRAKGVRLDEGKVPHSGTPTTLLSSLNEQLDALAPPAKR